MTAAKYRPPELPPFGESKTSRKTATTSCAPPAPGATVQLCMKRTGKPPSKKLNSPEAVCDYFRPYANADRESFRVLHLDAHNRVIGHEEAHRGTLSEVGVHPREVFKGAILNNAVSVLVAHNHPSGVAEPSGADLELTRRLAEAGHLLGIPVRDHVIVGADAGCYSMRTDIPTAARFGSDEDVQAPRVQSRRRRSSGASRAAEKTACPPGCEKAEKDPAHTALMWGLTVVGAMFGAVALWKWRSISTAGVPLGFALRRTFSRNFGEGHVGLKEAWDRQRRPLPPAGAEAA